MSSEMMIGTGDGSANFNQIYGLYRRKVFALCLRLTKDIVASEDLTQDVFLQVYRKMSSFRGDAAFATWLYRVARNVVLMHMRKRSIQTVAADVSELEEGAATAVSTRVAGVEPLRCLALKRAISSLPEHRRHVLIMHDIHGFTHRELSSRLGIQAGTSKSQLHHAHISLRSEAWHDDRVQQA